MSPVAAGIGCSIALLASTNQANEQLRIDWEVSTAKSGQAQLSITAITAPDQLMSRSGLLSAYPEIGSAAFAGRSTAPVHFRIQREAGTLACEGTAGSGRGAGSCTFRAATGYSEQLGKRGVALPDTLQALRMALSNVTLAYIDSIAQAGLRENDPDQLIRLRHHDIAGAYVQGLRGAGVPDLDSNRVIRLSNHAVDAVFVAGLRDAGLTDLGVEGLVRMRNHGVDAAFVRKVRAAGITDLAPEQLIRYRRRGYDRN